MQPMRRQRHPTDWLFILLCPMRTGASEYFGCIGHQLLKENYKLDSVHSVQNGCSIFCNPVAR